jgi:hypothetical protein
VPHRAGARFVPPQRSTTNFNAEPDATAAVKSPLAPRRPRYP